jgi:hypothetical protein
LIQFPPGVRLLIGPAAAQAARLVRMQRGWKAERQF